MILRVIDTTDGRFLGRILDLPDVDMSGLDISLEDDIDFDVTNYSGLGNGKHRYSNPHYIVICEEV